jgi:imidazolonepropionase
MTTIWQNATLAPMSSDAPERMIERGAMVVDHDRLLWVGHSDELPQELRRAATDEIDVAGALLTPGLIDCHTHLVYGGTRAHEFELRLQGKSYEEIARAGGGVRSTVAATRANSDEELFAQASRRLQAMQAEGLTAIEIKSGYGLTQIDETRMLRAARRLGQEHGLTVRTTYLGAHALAPEYESRADAYIEAVCSWLRPLQAEGLVDAVDVFCDRIGFTGAQTRRVFEAARALGLPVKLHAEQLSNQHGAKLAAQFGALSCDHLEHLDEEGVRAMAAAGTVAVLLPGAYYFLRETRSPPVPALRAAGVPIAIATDHNPGSSPVLSPVLMLNMACVLFGLTPWEALRGMTVHAARALGLQDTHGVLAQGMRADFVVWDAESPRDLAYRAGGNPCWRTVLGGMQHGLERSFERAFDRPASRIAAS